MKSVVICGSLRFKEEMHVFAEKLRSFGVVVYEPEYVPLDDSTPEQYKNFIALGMTHEHFYKIRMADVVFIYNKDGYSGNSTTLEIGYSVAAGKPLYALEGDFGEVCRHILFRETIASPEKLIERL